MLRASDEFYFRNLGAEVEVKTPQVHYIGVIIGYLHRSQRYEMRITRVVCGKLKVGRLVREKNEKFSLRAIAHRRAA